MEVPTEPNHLGREARELLAKSNEDKIRAIEEDIYIPYSSADVILLKMKRFLAKENSGRPLGLLIVSPSGNGKTTLLKTFEGMNPSMNTPTVILKPVILLQAPPVPSEKRLAGEIIRAIGPLDYDKGNAEYRLKRVRQLVALCKVKVLLIDEIHNLLAGSSRSIEETCGLIKYLSNELGLAIVLAGTERAENVVASDYQLMSRFPISKIPLWYDGKSYREFLTFLESTIPLPKPSNLASDDKAAYLLRESGGILAPIVQSVKNAAFEAICNGDLSITMELLKRNSVKGRFESEV